METKRNFFDTVLTVLVTAIWFLFQVGTWVLFLLTAACIASDFGG
jgi:hypothetical protein